MKHAIHLIAGCSILVAACSQTPSSEGNETAADTPDEASAQTADPEVALVSLTGNAEAGERVFMRCQQCHTLEAGINRTGPSLHGIVGRPAASVTGFNYSPAMTSSGLTWDPDTLFRYLENPRSTVPGSRMIFAGIADPQQRADLIAYLETRD